MARHCQGEDLKIGANLTWGPCFDYQKQFFTGADDKVSRSPYLLRYDIEVSGFGSHKSGHLCLLRLKEQMYPGGESKDHWPTLCLNTLRWAQKQGALCGPAHSGWGLQPTPPTEELPNDEIPPFNGIGANEYIVDVTHEVPGPDGKPVPAVDFLSIGRYAAHVGTEHLVSHAQRRLPHAHQRRDGFPVHLRRARRPRPQLREAGRPAELRRLVRRRSARAAAT